MAVKGAVRYKPDTYRSSLETLVAGLSPQGAQTNPGVQPPTYDGVPAGDVVMVAQLVAYDDVQLQLANYKPGDPLTEQYITVLHERPITLALAAFNGLTQTQATALWTAELNSYKTWVTPAATTLLRAIRAARRANPVLL